MKFASDIIKQSFKYGQKWLVYCEDREQLTQVMSSIRDEGIYPTEYHSKMESDQTATISSFRSADEGILMSIRCLDEGIDIPDTSHALILSSSQNPRQFIQRRGRVLRRAPGKQIAVIHDAVVVPVNTGEEPEQINLLKSELSRAIQFAEGALNKGASAELRKIAIDMGINPDSLAENGIEGEENY